MKRSKPSRRPYKKRPLSVVPTRLTRLGNFEWAKLPLGSLTLSLSHGCNDDGLSAEDRANLVASQSRMERASPERSKSSLKAKPTGRLSAEDRANPPHNLRRLTETPPSRREKLLPEV